MAYDDARYSRAVSSLSNSIAELAECDIPREDIEALIEDALDDAFEESN